MRIGPDPRIQARPRQVNSCVSTAFTCAVPHKFSRRKGDQRHRNLIKMRLAQHPVFAIARPFSSIFAPKNTPASRRGETKRPFISRLTCGFYIQRDRSLSGDYAIARPVVWLLYGGPPHLLGVEGQIGLTEMHRSRSVQRNLRCANRGGVHRDVVRIKSCLTVAK